MNTNIHIHPVQIQSGAKSLSSGFIRHRCDDYKDRDLMKIPLILKQNGYQQHKIQKKSKDFQNRNKGQTDTRPAYLKGALEKMGPLSYNLKIQ